MAFKNSSPINMAGFRVDRRPMAQAAAAKASIWSGLGKAVQTGIQKAQEKRQKAVQKENLTQVVQGILGKKAEKKLAREGIELSAIVGSLENPEDVIGLASQLEGMAQQEKQLKAQKQKEQLLKDHIAKLAGTGAGGMSPDVLNALGQTSPGALASMISNIASQKVANNGPQRLTGDAAQIDKAYEWLQSEDSTERKKGALLVSKLEGLSPEEQLKFMADSERVKIESRAEAEKTVNGAKKRQGAARQIMDLNQKIAQAEAVLEDTSPLNSGMAQAVLKWVPGTSQQAREENIESLTAFIALDGMLNLKKDSPTGSTGFGQLSEKELGVLQKRIASLSSSLNEADFKKNLGLVLETFKRTKGLIELEYLGWSDNPDEMLGRIKQVGLSNEDAKTIFSAQGKTMPDVETSTTVIEVDF